MSEHIPTETQPCPFCGGDVDPQGWLGGDGTRGPECEECGATAQSMEDWNKRHCYGCLEQKHIPQNYDKLSHLRGLIENDCYATSFQSMGQYRSALLKEMK